MCQYVSFMMVLIFCFCIHISMSSGCLNNTTPKCQECNTNIWTCPISNISYTGFSLCFLLVCQQWPDTIQLIFFLFSLYFFHKWQKARRQECNILNVRSATLAKWCSTWNKLYILTYLGLKCIWEYNFTN